MSDINHKDEFSDTPLHWAVILDDNETVQFLLKNGADPSKSNTKGSNVIMTACINQRLEILKTLISHIRGDNTNA